MKEKLLRPEVGLDSGDRGTQAPARSEGDGGAMEAAALQSQAQFGPTVVAQQQVEEPAPLTSGQVADALRYYNLLRSTTDGSKKYSNEIVKQIQAEVNAPVTGTPNAEMAQGVARRQAQVNRERTPNPPLAVDGKAGPRTLPILFPVGLAEDKAIEAYAKDVEKSKPELEAATTDQQRAEVVLRLINTRLAAAKIPPIDKVTANDDDANRMIPSEWRINFRPTTLADTNQAVTIGYHEARHAEQAFRVARMLARKGRKPAQIEREAGIRLDKAVEAVEAEAAEPMSAMESLMAEGWHEPEIGKPATLGQLQNRRSAAAGTLLAAVQAFRADSSPANRAKMEAAFRAFKQAETDVRNEPGEYDSQFLEDKVADKVGLPRDPDLTLEDILARN